MKDYSIMSNWISNFKKYIPLLSELVARDIKTKYRRSVLGVLWTLLNPLLMMIVLSIVFSQLFGRFAIENYPIYLLSGQVIFNFFSESTSTSMSAIINNAPLLKKVYIPKYVFVLAKTISISINLFASFAALIIVMLVMRTPLYYTMVLSIIPVFFLILLSVGVGLILATMAVKFRDIVHLYTVLTTVLMYLTPVIYPIECLPGWVSTIVKINPITSILTMFRDFMLYGCAPDVFTVCMTVLPSVGFLVLGAYVFYKNQDDFILYV